MRFVVPAVVRVVGASCALAALACGFAAQGQKLFKYQDANGTWVFTDRQPDASQPYEQSQVQKRFEPPEIRLFQQARSDGITLIAQSTFYAPVQLAYRLVNEQNVAGNTPREGLKVLKPRGETPLLFVGKAAPGADLRFDYEYQFLPGEPGAEHRPEQPYRLPFALSTTVPVSQAFPDTVTHGDPGSQYAIDFVMPVGTHVFAAREGVVIDVASDFFEHGTDLSVDGPRANIVRVLHDDGTMALYGHLNWNSIRVVPGQHVRRGEYLADSGNTGFTTGPHLHFVVQRNRGGALVSIPVEFMGPGGAPITVRSRERYTAR
ncbi:MAG TPA: M23 family metallopeptidase [Gammaproteobacteria bacterium]|jgi:murein DD-endopeptidase MepM/ murein hydrolase activator NlpD|nr:M23 family metallopeptidase [Gammaproteobacteria bacterium]